jgi:2-C-methyl-D-erythritol 4-phosphate cytidylyltransferase
MPKQFREVAGAPLVLHALRPFLRHPEVATVVLVLPEAEAAAPPSWLGALTGDRLRVVAGGATRQESARCGCAALPEECGIVLVHDGARPLVEDAVIDAIIAEARRGHGAIAALRQSDTLKQVDGRRVTRTLPREGVWRAQTPQGFPRVLLERGFAGAGAAMTDEAGLVEAVGGEVVVVESSARNIKVTTADDLLLAELLLRAVR